jgi:hypothetical protein
MSDIVEQLRQASLNQSDYRWEAADEIERLRAALEPLACTCDRPNGAACSRSEVDCPFWNARAALGIVDLDDVLAPPRKDTWV